MKPTSVDELIREWCYDCIESTWELIPIFKNFSDDTKALLSYTGFVIGLFVVVDYILKVAL